MSQISGSDYLDAVRYMGTTARRASSVRQVLDKY